MEGKVNPASLAAVTRGSDVYAVPYNFYPSSGVVMYNEKIWADAGIDPSTAKTWDEFMGLAQTVTKRDANGKITLAGYSGQRDSYALYLAWLMQLGGKAFNDDGTAAFNSEAGKAALQQYADIYQKWKTDDFEFGDTITSFNQGLVGATMVGPWYESILAKDHPDIKLGHLVQPPIAGAKPGEPNLWPVIEVWSHLVSAEGAKKAGTWRFLEFLLRPDIAARWSQFSGEMTTVTEALGRPEVTETPYLAPYAGALAYGVSENVTEYLSTEVTDALSTMLESVARGQASVDDALATAEAEVNRLTARIASR
jgi:multiple sugar transport system substrate-binding protein